MSGFLCSMVGASFTVVAAAEVLRSKKSITAVGNAQIDTAQSKFSGSALLCDGTGDYVRSPAGTQWDFGTGSFTIEYFIRFNAINTLYVPIALRTSASILNGEWWCEITAAENKMYWGFKNYAGTQYYVNLALAGTAFATGQWYHIALVNNAGTAQMYVNGTATGTTTALSGSFGISTTDLWVGAGAGAYSVNGWMDEVRISNTARYTAGFTPTTTPFVNDANTLLLIHANGTDASTFFEDDNGVRAPIGLIANNQVQISTAQSKFGGSSILFDGNNDFVSLPSGIPDVTASNFTFECWARFDILPHNQTLSGGGYIMLAVGGSADYMLISREGVSGSQVSLSFANVGQYASFTKSGVNYAINTWYHIAFVRTSGVVKAFFNGTELTTFRNDSGFTNSGRTQNIYIGRIGTFIDERGSMDGYLDEIRVSNSARYTADFTPSTTPFVNDANTLLLIHADGTNASTVFLDDNGVGRSQNNGRRNSSPVISTTRSKFGGSSIYLPSDYVTFANEIIFPDNQDFTWEFWVNEDVVQNCKYIGGQTAGDIFIGHDSYGNDTYNNRLAVGVVAVGWYMDFGVTLAADTWYHICVQRSGDTVYGYTDGTLRVTHTGYLANYSWSWRNLQLSGERDGLTLMNGYQDEIRFSNIVRYATAGFTAPTAPFQNDANTVLLIHGDGTNNSTVFTDDNGIAPYTP